MVKALLITGSLCLAAGTIGGYFLQRMEAASTSIQNAQTIAALSIPAKSDEAIAANITQKADRQALISKLALCLNRPIAKQLSDKWTDKQLNDLTFEICNKQS
jgi:hypothetical protein